MLAGIRSKVTWSGDIGRWNKWEDKAKRSLKEIKTRKSYIEERKKNAVMIVAFLAPRAQIRDALDSRVGALAPHKQSRETDEPKSSGSKETILKIFRRPYHDLIRDISFIHLSPYDTQYHDISTTQPHNYTFK